MKSKRLNTSEQSVADALSVLEDFVSAFRGRVRPSTYVAFAEVLGITVPGLKRNIRRRKMQYSNV